MSPKTTWLREELIASRLAADEELPEVLRWIEIDTALLQVGGRPRSGEVSLPPEWIAQLCRWRIAGLRPLVAAVTVEAGDDLDEVRRSMCELDVLTGGTLDAIRLLPSPLPTRQREPSSLEPAPLQTDPGRFERIRSALLGLAIGDSLGAPIENMPAEKVSRLYGAFRDFQGGRGWGPGYPTRETTFALLWFREFAPGRSVHAAQDRARLARSLARWVVARPRDFGHLTRGILRAFLEDAPVPAAREVWVRAREAAEFNAALSRAAAVGAALPDQMDLRWTSALAASAMTHPAPVCLACAVAVADGVAAAVRGEDPLEAARASVWEERTAEALAELDKNWAPGGQSWASYGRSHPLKTLQSAFWAARQSGSFEDVLLDLVHRGGDADTHGAVAGAILGAMKGPDALPARWLDQLRVRDLIVGLIRRYAEQIR
jgi:ADP-ribosylglycohydrolase